MSKEAKNNVIPQEVLNEKRYVRNLHRVFDMPEPAVDVPVPMPENMTSAEVFTSRLLIRENARAGGFLLVADFFLRRVYQREFLRFSIIDLRSPHTKGSRPLEFPGAVE